MASQHLKDKIKNLPLDPGCYLMKDQSGKVIYVGKAKHLKKRVGSYFVDSAGHTNKTKKLVKEITDFDVILTGTEIEALLLERTLIRDHQPQYNILLRDDREYPYIRVDYKENWPRIEKVRKRKNDGAYYRGPFGSEGQLNLMIQLVYRIFPMIRCSRYELENAKRPCNYYDMKMCLAPCHLEVEKSEYLEMIKNALDILEGKNQKIAQSLEKNMMRCSAEEKYEQAALYRDQSKALEYITQKQSAVVKDIFDGDVIGVNKLHGKLAFHILFVREGRLSGSDNFVVKARLHSIEEALPEFLVQYYESHPIPDEIFLPRSFEDMGILQEALNTKKELSKKTYLKVPEKGSKKDLVQMAMKNASYQLEEDLRTVTTKKIHLEMVKSRLRLQKTPHRIECIDISNLQNVAIVASNVCFMDGKPAKDKYRIYTIKETDGKQDDFKSIYEVVRRRIRRITEQDDAPDLLVIDGGKGQLSSALKAAAEFPEIELEIISLAKSRVQDSNFSAPTRSSERIFRKGSLVPELLKNGSPEYRLLTSIRDEAHRFAITHHRKKRDKISRASILSEIDGIGPTLEKRLLETFKGLQGIKEASLDQLKNVKGLSEKVAIVLHSQLKSDQ